MTNQHLTDEQFTDVLAGDCGLEVSRHLETCSQCRREAQQVQTAIREFTATGMGWAEEQGPASLSARSRWILHRKAVGSCAAAVVLAAAILFGLHQEETAPVVSVATASEVERAESPVDVAEDNRLLAAIDTEIRWQAQSPVSIETIGRTSRSRSSRKLAN